MRAALGPVARRSGPACDCSPASRPRSRTSAACRRRRAARGRAPLRSDSGRSGSPSKSSRTQPRPGDVQHLARGGSRRGSAAAEAESAAAAAAKTRARPVVGGEGRHLRDGVGVARAASLGQQRRRGRRRWPSAVGSTCGERGVHLGGRRAQRARLVGEVRRRRPRASLATRQASSAARAGTPGRRRGGRGAGRLPAAVGHSPSTLPSGRGTRVRAAPRRAPSGRRRRGSRRGAAPGTPCR